MLVLSRKVGERIIIGENIVVEVLEIPKMTVVRLGVFAPPDVRIMREELLLKDRGEEPGGRTRESE